MGQRTVIAVEAAEFTDLFRSQYGRVVASLRLAGASAAEAEDAAQEAFARTFVHWRRVRAGTSPTGYVFRAAFRRWRGRRPIPADPGDDTFLAGLADVRPGPEQRALDRMEVEEALARLPRRQRACAVLCLVVGLDAEEAGRALGISPATVRVHVHRARAAMTTHTAPALTPAQQERE